jgi:hypothetical protein
MSDWNPVVARDVQPGDQLQLPSGDEMVASRIECPFMGTDTLVAIIEDTPTRWFKQPLPADLEVQVRRASG